MNTTPNRLQTHWGEAQAFLKSTWPRLTDVDLEEIEGRYDRLIEKIKLLYGGGQEIQIEAGIKTRLQKYLNSIDNLV